MISKLAIVLIPYTAPQVKDDNTNYNKTYPQNGVHIIALTKDKNRNECCHHKAYARPGSIGNTEWNIFQYMRQCIERSYIATYAGNSL